MVKLLSLILGFSASSAARSSLFSKRGSNNDFKLPVKAVAWGGSEALDVCPLCNRARVDEIHSYALNKCCSQNMKMLSAEARVKLIFEVGCLVYLQGRYTGLHLLCR